MANDGAADRAHATLREYANGQKIFGRYTLKKILGRGGMGIVWLARDEELERDVALKFLPDLIVLDKSLLSELKRETRRSLELTHKNIVRIYDFVHSENSACISMEYIDGETLSNLRAEKEQRVFQPDEISAWTAQLCDALDYAHNHARIIHRDIKPANLMVNRKGNLKVSDFGIARSLGDSMSKLTLASGTSGTLVYMSPQQLDGERGTHLDDIYSLGATLYDLLSSKPPFYSGNVDKQIHERVAPSMTERRKEFNIEPASVPAIWEETIAACLAKDPGRRPQSTAEVAKRLQLDTPQRGWARPIRTTRQKTKTLAVIAIAALFVIGLVGLYFGVVTRQAKPVSQAAAVPDKSIAVLPFENRSEDQANAYFADGIQDEILTRLSNIADLKVISRTSTQHYKSAPENLPEIARQLGVAHIVEGSVQKIGDAVRVNVQLIKAANDSHLWAATFDRKLTDIFSVESEVAKAIADQLQAHLTAGEEQVIAAKPTNNPEAYDAYLRGSAFYLRGLGTPGGASDPVLKAAGFYEKAVELDPNFALAWARLSRADAFLYLSRNQDPTLAGRGEAAKHAWEMAQKLAPDSPETLLALGYYQYWALRDFGLAKATFESVNKMLPGSSEVPLALGLIARREGRWDESIACFEQALALDPRNVELLRRASATYGMLQHHSAQRKLVDRVLDIMPNDPDAMAAKAGTYQAQGDLQEAGKFLSETNEQTPSDFIFAAKIDQLQLERNYGEAIRLLRARLTQDDDGGYHVTLAFMQRFAGDTAGAKATAEEARNILEPLSRDRPEDYDLATLMSQAYAVLGEKDSALKAAERAIMILPSAKDPLNGPRMEENLALIQTIFGENSRAISTLTRLLQTPYGLPRITPALLRLDPVWDPLRADPRFQKLCEEKEQTGSNK